MGGEVVREGIEKEGERGSEKKGREKERKRVGERKIEKNNPAMFLCPLKAMPSLYSPRSKHFKHFFQLNFNRCKTNLVYNFI